MAGCAAQQTRIRRIGLKQLKLNRPTPNAPSQASMLRKSSCAESSRSSRKVGARRPRSDRSAAVFSRTNFPTYNGRNRPPAAREHLAGSDPRRTTSRPATVPTPRRSQPVIALPREALAFWYPNQPPRWRRLLAAKPFDASVGGEQPSRRLFDWKQFCRHAAVNDGA